MDSNSQNMSVPSRERPQGEHFIHGEGPDHIPSIPFHLYGVVHGQTVSLKVGSWHESADSSVYSISHVAHTHITLAGDKVWWGGVGIRAVNNRRPFTHVTEIDNFMTDGCLLL